MDTISSFITKYVFCFSKFFNQVKNIQIYDD